MLKKLQLTNFRSYVSYEVDFDRITVFIGRNGIGKTNILEAVSYLALARSFRTRQDKEVIRWGEEAARLVGQTEESLLEVAISQQGRGNKLIKVDGINRRAIELLGHLAVVLFLPESLQLVDGAPHLRRQFLDLLLIQEDRRYAYHLLQLQKVLRQRNKLLKLIDEGQAEADQLSFWDDSLVEHSSQLFVRRATALQSINEVITAHYKTMSNRPGELMLHYKVAAVSESAGDQERFKNPADCPKKPEEWQRLLRETLQKYQYREIAAGSSLYGPQRDDFTFMLNDRPLASFGSRGEFRSAILALKAAEADYLLHHFEETGQSVPLVFLLDDVYSELDEVRRGQLAQLIGSHQAIITTTDLSHLDPTIQESAKVISLTD